jgi:hypothetical protein
VSPSMSRSWRSSRRRPREASDNDRNAAQRLGTTGGHDEDRKGAHACLDGAPRRPVEEVGQVAHRATSAASARHFAFGFRGSSFECPARDLTAHVVGQTGFRSEYEPDR